MGGAVGDHLKIDLGLIRATGAGLGRIKDALHQAEATQPGVGVLGSGELAGAMDEFVDNWKIHRKKLVASVEAHQKMAVDSAEAYEDTDEGLAKELTEPRPAGGASPGVQVS
ncbi:MAG: hypothetical protein M3228_15280 [Actinomycetota bacterium]|nr:hypothetical protein [Actinomycetota bacterium]MDQ4012015.1 hypothetical protein [Actinomycetota bacterium]